MLGNVDVRSALKSDLESVAGLQGASFAKPFKPLAKFYVGERRQAITSRLYAGCDIPSPESWDGIPDINVGAKLVQT